ncbi:hypothetical protein EVAR_83740_1 [Eumeta japonica]|uniref:Uncharacterized protein n=1 Tax=Eumeta variegata TaxID=151549 RepID=A0A4C1WD33_EUMVA|nr:hypothetical protein EVAR_83740_1 [Eumeta japonica]
MLQHAACKPPLTLESVLPLRNPIRLSIDSRGLTYIKHLSTDGPEPQAPTSTGAGFGTLKADVADGMTARECGF